MLTKIEAKIKNGNQITGYDHFWCHNHADLPEPDDCEIQGEVSSEELIAEPGSAEQAFCGDGDSCRTVSELADFVRWLVDDHEYPISVALQCAANLAKSRED